MRFHSLSPQIARKKSRRVGRGIAAGQGKTAGRGTKGQKSRTGANSSIPRTFEGGSTSLIQRLPKLKGFKSRRAKPITLRYARLEKVFTEDELVTLGAIIEKGLVHSKEAEQGVKIVGPRSVGTKMLIIATDNPKLRLSVKLLAKT